MWKKTTMRRNRVNLLLTVRILLLSRRNVEDGNVQSSCENSVTTKKKCGGWKCAIILLANQGLATLAFFGVGVNLVMFLTRVLGFASLLMDSIARTYNVDDVKYSGDSFFSEEAVSRLIFNYPSVDGEYLSNSYMDLLQKAYLGAPLSPQKSQYGVPYLGKSVSLNNNLYRNPSFGLGMSYSGNPLGGSPSSEFSYWIWIWQSYQTH